MTFNNIITFGIIGLILFLCGGSLFLAAYIFKVIPDTMLIDMIMGTGLGLGAMLCILGLVIPLPIKLIFGQSRLKSGKVIYMLLSMFFFLIPALWIKNEKPMVFDADLMWRAIALTVSFCIGWMFFIIGMYFVESKET